MKYMRHTIACQKNYEKICGRRLKRHTNSGMLKSAGEIVRLFQVKPVF